MRVCDLSVGVLCYYVGPDHIYALLLDQKGDLRRFNLFRCAEAFPLVDRLADVLEQPYAYTPSQRADVLLDFGEHWGRRLLPPIEALQPFDILAVVPHHFLHGIPLHLVKCAEKPLALTHGIAYCSSGTLLTRCAERNLARHFPSRDWTFPFNNDGDRPGGPPVSSCLSYGVDVLTDKDAEYRALAEAFASGFPNRAIATGRNEVKTAIDVYRRTFRGEAAWTEPDAICLVCHGYYDAMSVERSGLLLARHRGETNLRNLKTHGTTIRLQDHPFAEIPYRLEPRQPHSAEYGIFDPEMLASSELEVQCETDAQLVALFGCSTGTGAVSSTDDFVSHAYHWLKAGAASVVANLWEADFTVITDWTKRFATNWVQRREPKALAAREATLTLLADRPELAGQPALWGSVALLGDWL